MEKWERKVFFFLDSVFEQRESWKKIAGRGFKKIT